MKTVLRSSQTGLYVQSAEEWTGRPEEARDFKTMRQAIRFASQAGFRKMQLAFIAKDLPCPPPISLESLQSRLSVSDRID